MRLLIPSLKSSRCVMLSVCGIMHGADDALLPKLEKLNAKAARYKGAFLQLFASKQTRGIHLHLDAIEAEYFNDMRRAPATAKKKQIDELLSLVEGQQLDADIVARFEVPMNRLQEHFAEPLAGDTFNEGAMKATIRSMAMEYRFENAPIEYLRTYSLSKSLVGVELSLPTKTEIRRQYLADAFKIANVLVKKVVLDERENGEDQEDANPPEI